MTIFQVAICAAASEEVCFRMEADYEIIGTIAEPGDCYELLYAPIEQHLSYQKSTRYDFEFEGASHALDQFVRQTLLDPISQAIVSDASAWAEEAFCLEFGMKPGALDLEKEAILTYYHSLDAPEFTLSNLRIRRLIHVFGSATTTVQQRFVRDLVNPAIHTHVLHAA